MRRLLPFLAAAAALTAAAPASAAIYPVCGVQLVNAAYGTSHTCTAGNSPQISGAVTRRVLTVEVSQGAVVASITCGYGTYARSTSKFMYAVAGPQTIKVLENANTTCRSTLTSQVNGTVANGVSTYEYAFIGPVA